MAHSPDQASRAPVTGGKDDGAIADVHDIEAFLVTLPKARQRRLLVLRQ